MKGDRREKREVLQEERDERRQAYGEKNELQEIHS